MSIDDKFIILTFIGQTNLSLEKSVTQHLRCAREIEARIEQEAWESMKKNRINNRESGKRQAGTKLRNPLDQ